MHCFDERLRTPPTQIANATTQIANAIRSDCERYTTTKVDVLFDKS